MHVTFARSCPIDITKDRIMTLGIKCFSLIFTIVAGPALGADLTVTFAKTGQGGTLPPENASCVAASGRAAPGLNRSPGLSWSEGPAGGTRSYALTMVDPDVPADLSLLNKDSTVIGRDAPRMEFAHWVLADIPVSRRMLGEGADGDGLPQGGLALKRTDYGRRGQNGFAAFLKDGAYGGYMGACPPWNDERVHRYRVTVYALDIDTLDLPDSFTRADLVAAMKGHLVSSGSAELSYSINAEARE
jgi:Raf kinase inhibitor-like YbhB/YbcL family protein